MKAASVSEIKKELQHVPPEQLLQLCMQVVKYKKDNKELVSYLLFEANNPELYLKEAIKEMDELFNDVNTSSVFFAKKTLRKILRNITKYSKHTGSNTFEIELLIHFCQKMNNSELNIQSSQLLINMYQRQVDKCYKIITQLHEDLQYDYQEVIKNLRE